MRKCILAVVLVLCMFQITFAQSNVEIWKAHAITVDGTKWELIDPPVKIVIGSEKIQIYSQAFQEYHIIRTIENRNDGAEISGTWLAVDGNGTRVWIALGSLTSDKYGVYVKITYSDHWWAYRCYSK